MPDYQGLARVDEIRVFDIVPAHQIQHRYAPVIGDLDEGIAAFDGVADLLAPGLGYPAARLRKLFVVYAFHFMIVHCDASCFVVDTSQV